MCKRGEEEFLRRCMLKLLPCDLVFEMLSRVGFSTKSIMLFGKSRSHQMLVGDLLCSCEIVFIDDFVSHKTIDLATKTCYYILSIALLAF
jgi:hypothetical protein